MIRVAVIDDQELIREGLAMIVGSAPDIDVVLSGADGQDLVDAVAERRPIDVALVDVRIPVSTASRRPAASSAVQALRLSSS